MAKELTPTEFTFHSFRHSQGNYPAQHAIFRYFKDTFGIEPDLDPSEEVLERYLRYIGGTSCKVHIQYSHQGPDNARKFMLETWKDLRRQMANPHTINNNPDLTPLYVKTELLTRLCEQELRILDPNIPWGEHMDWERLNNTIDPRYTSRLQQRFSTNMASFLFSYGRDQKPTGIDEFDAMYADVWKLREQMITEGHADTALREKLLLHQGQVHSVIRTYEATGKVRARDSK